MSIPSKRLVECFPYALHSGDKEAFPAARAYEEMNIYPENEYSHASKRSRKSKSQGLG